MGSPPQLLGLFLSAGNQIERDSMSIEHIRHLDQTIGIIIRANFHSDGIEFFTPSMFSQQLGYMNRPAGYKIDPHVHNPVEREVLWTQEVLLIKSGKVR